MNKIDRSEVLGLSDYEKARPSIRQHVIDLKRDRRISVGDRVSLVFENHETLLFQTMEMVRAEQMTSNTSIDAELKVYNSLIPEPGQLSATLFIEITDKERIRQDLHGLVGIDEHVMLEIGERRIAAEFEEGRSTEEKLSSVQYIRFDLDDDAQSRLADLRVPARIRIDHPRYEHQAELSPATRASLLKDLS